MLLHISLFARGVRMILDQWHVVVDAPRYLDPRILRIGRILILCEPIDPTLVGIAPARSLLEIGDATDSIDIVD